MVQPARLKGKRISKTLPIFEMLSSYHQGIARNSASLSKGLIAPSGVSIRSSDSTLDHLAPIKKLASIEISRTTAPDLVNPSQSIFQNLFQKLMKVYLDKQGLSEGKQEVPSRPVKYKNLNLYYRNSHMKYFYLCRQCEDHFNTVRAKRQKQVFFAASLIKN